MEKTGVISAYADLLAGRLSFDRALARAVRSEIEDHLREAVAADDRGSAVEAERRAVANFGDPDVIAAQFVAVSLARQTKKVGAAIILVIGAAFAAMKARLAWYAMTQWAALPDDLKSIGGLVGTIDAYAFWIALVVGIAGFVCTGRKATLAASRLPDRRQRAFFLLLAVIATGALAVSVISDGVLTGLRLSSAGWSADAIVPVISMVIEIVGAGVLVSYVRTITQRMAFAAAART